MNHPLFAPLPAMPGRWDYLILTASHADQASAYEAQLAARRGIGLLTRVRETLVVADLEGRRIGSGGSTLECLRLVVNRERRGRTGAAEVLAGLRILIVHAGGDSRRLPAYGPAGKIFIPVPGETDAAVPYTLFDRLVPAYLDLPAPADGRGQVVVAAGDALLLFRPRDVHFPGSGVTMLGSPAAPGEASRHGVFCPGPGTTVRVYLQKPPVAEQMRMGALDRAGKALLDVGVTNLDAAGAAALLGAFEVRFTAAGENAGGAGRTPAETGGAAAQPGRAPARAAGGGREGICAGEFAWSPAVRERMLTCGIDLYREICCALGAEATPEHYLRAVRAAGSKWPDEDLTRLFPALHAIPFHVEAVPGCRFLHFGSTHQLAASGLAMLVEKYGAIPESTCLAPGNEVSGEGQVSGHNSWVEGCRIAAPVALAGHNAVIGADIAQPLALPARAALDVLEGRGVWYVRCYGTGDSFKDASFHGQPLADWLAAAGATEDDVWPPEETDRTLWTARVFPEAASATGFQDWLWMYRPAAATPAQKSAWRAATRRSAAEIALLAGQDAFHRRRAAIRAEQVRQSPGTLFSRASGFSARDLEFALRHSTDPEGLAAAVVTLARTSTEGNFTAARIRHTLGTATGDAAMRASALRLAQLPVPPFNPCVLAGAATTLPAYAAEYGSAVLTLQPDGVTLETVCRGGERRTYYLPPLPPGTVAIPVPPDFDSLLAGYLNRDRAVMAALATELCRVHCLAGAILQRHRAAILRYLQPCS